MATRKHPVAKRTVKKSAPKKSTSPRSKKSQATKKGSAKRPAAKKAARNWEISAQRKTTKSSTRKKEVSTRKLMKKTAPRPRTVKKTSEAITKSSTISTTASRSSRLIRDLDTNTAPVSRTQDSLVIPSRAATSIIVETSVGTENSLIELHSPEGKEKSRQRRLWPWLLSVVFIGAFAFVIANQGVDDSNPPGKPDVVKTSMASEKDSVEDSAIVEETTDEEMQVVQSSEDRFKLRYRYTSTGIQIFPDPESDLGDVVRSDLFGSSSGSSFRKIASMTVPFVTFPVTKVDTIGETRFRIEVTTESGDMVTSRVLVVEGRFSEVSK